MISTHIYWGKNRICSIVPHTQTETRNKKFRWNCKNGLFPVTEAKEEKKMNTRARRGEISTAYLLDWFWRFFFGYYNWWIYWDLIFNRIFFLHSITSLYKYWFDARVVFYFYSVSLSSHLILMVSIFSENFLYFI